jgi:4-amino-4-deoxy-L-arabinose transferase-like glycosyltransferase
VLALVNRYPRLVIAAFATLLFVPGLGAVHLFDWDEINFAEIAREMVVSGDWSRPTIGFVPFHEKPPLFMWLQAMSMGALGVNEFAARLPNALCGILTLIVLHRIGVRWRGQAFGLLWPLAYAGSILPHLYFRSGIIDPWFNLFIFLGIAAFMRTTEEGSVKHALFSGIWLGLAVMTKGPAAIIITGLTVSVFWALQRFRMFFQWTHMLLMVLAALVVIALWFGNDYLRHGPDFTRAFFQRQVELFTQEDAGHGGFFGYHFVVLLLGCFPASFFAVQEMCRPSTQGSEDVLAMTRRKWMLTLFWVVLILFSIVKTKIVHYSSLCYFPLTFLAALQLERIVARNEAFGWTRFAVGIMGNIVGALVLALPILMMNVQLIAPLFSADPFAQGNLEADVHWHWSASLAGAWLIGMLGFAHVLHQRKQHARSAIVLFAGTGLFVTLTLHFLIRNIEAYSQRAAVQFFEGHAGERCWLFTRGYKSYVPEFYGGVREARPDEATLLSGLIDRPVYLSCKITSVEEVKALGAFRETGRKNGFVFWERRP